MHLSADRLFNCIVFFAFLVVPQMARATTSATYVIVFHGDGMGQEHVRAGGMYLHGAAGTMVFESFPNQTTMTHNNASNTTTDSAASASAMATGLKVNNGVISQAIPGDGSDQITLLEMNQFLNRSTGLVTESFLTDASPACYGAHETSRSNYSEINDDYFLRSQPNVLMGGGGYGIDTVMAVAQGYTAVSDRTSLFALDTETETRLAGVFGTGLIPTAGTSGRDPSLPTLPEMTQQALAILDNDSHGFFLFVEDEDIDEQSHGNDADGLVLAIAEFNNAIEVAIDWVDNTGNASTWSNTLMIVLADHETGGLTVTETSPSLGVVPAMSWSTTGHTQTVVPVYARGQDADQLTGAVIDNTDIFTLLSPSAWSTPTPTGTPTATATMTPVATITISPTVSPTPTITQTITVSPTMTITLTHTKTATVSPTDTITPTGTPFKLLKGQALFYPQPAKDHITLTLAITGHAQITATIFNVTGERLLTYKENTEAIKGMAIINMDSDQLGPGIYFTVIDVTDEEGTRQIKKRVAIVH